MKELLLLLVQVVFVSSLFAELRAVYNNKVVEISWDSPKSIHVAYFVIERSKTGKRFKEFLKVGATKNNGNSVAYVEIDSHPFKSKTFYRIKQVDVRGNNHYTNIIGVHNFKHPKRSVGLFSFVKKNTGLKNFIGQGILVVLLDAHQKQFIVHVDIEQRKKDLMVTAVNHFLPKGAYLVTATSDNRIYGKKIIVTGFSSHPLNSLSIK